jgi:hypothetical protein
VQLSLAAPAGWTVTPAAGPTLTSVATGQSVSQTFSVTAPSTTAASAPLTGTASYGYDGGTPQTATATQTAKVVPSVKVNEVRLGVTGATTNQYIELYNAGSTPVDLSGYTVVYRSATAQADTTLATVPAGTTLAPGGYYVLGRSPGYTGTPNQTFTTSLSSSGGGVGLRDATGTLLVDSAGWGTANNALVENCPAPAPPTLAAPGASIVRRPNGVDTDANCADFAVTTVPSPGALNVVGVSASGGPTGTVPSTLALTLGTPASFGAFTPGVAHDYTATMSANVVSTAGDAALSLTDASANATGRLVNGAFALADPLQVMAASPAGTGAALAPLSTTAGPPLPLLTYSGPVSNDPVALTFGQHIGANEPLRTGAYAKTLTFTLSTTNP